MGKCAVPALIGALKDDNHTLRAGAAFVLGQIKDERAVDPLIPLLKDHSYDVYHYAVRALGEIGGEKSFDALISYISTNRHFDESALSALASFGDPRAVEPIIKVLHSGDKYGRQWAAKVLGELKDERAIKPLIAALRDSDEFVRSLSSGSMMNYPNGLEIMLTATTDKSAVVRREAAAQLSSHSGDERAAERLRAAFEEYDLAIIAGGCDFFIREGKAGSEDILISSLKKYGTYVAALSFLNCGNEKLKEAAVAWADSHGYITRASYSILSGTQWGQGN
jgi:HEAT repeat protein